MAKGERLNRDYPDCRVREDSRGLKNKIRNRIVRNPWGVCFARNAASRVSADRPAEAPFLDSLRHNLRLSMPSNSAPYPRPVFVAKVERRPAPRVTLWGFHAAWLDRPFDCFLYSLAHLHVDHKPFRESPHLPLTPEGFEDRSRGALCLSSFTPAPRPPPCGVPPSRSFSKRMVLL
jgi:hypothetical protein